MVKIRKCRSEGLTDLGLIWLLNPNLSGEVAVFSVISTFKLRLVGAKTFVCLLTALVIPWFSLLKNNTTEVAATPRLLLTPLAPQKNKIK